MKPEIISINFPILLTLIYVGLSLWMDLLPKHDFVTCFISHLENTDALSFSHLSSTNVLTLSKLNWHINIFSRNHIYSYYHPSLSENSFTFWEAVKLIGIDMCFLEFWFSLKNSFYHCGKYLKITVGYFPWNNSITLYFRKYLVNT